VDVDVDVDVDVVVVGMVVVQANSKWHLLLRTIAAAVEVPVLRVPQVAAKNRRR